MPSDPRSPETYTGRRLLTVLHIASHAPFSDISFPSAEEDIIAIEQEARTLARAEAVAVLRKAISDRYDDLRWCGKDDNCHDLAEGVEIVLSDFDAALSRLGERE
jgi:hypothetical protein